MHTLRTRFKKDIVTEFLPPARKTKKQRVVIVCGGMPGFPGKKDILEFYSKKGFWSFNPRYRGSWESDGKFLTKSPHLDVLDVIDQLPKGFVDLFGGKKYKVNPDQIFIIGTSFGGPAAILASLDSRVTKIICISPVVDWTKPGRVESIKTLTKFVADGFGQAYRMSKNGWTKLKSGKFYNPMNHVNNVEGHKILILHAKDDDVVTYNPVKKFARLTNAKLITLPRGGHLGSSILLKPRFYKIFTKFIKTNDKPHHLTNFKANSKRKIK